jgi:hypothetical protein
MLSAMHMAVRHERPLRWRQHATALLTLLVPLRPLGPVHHLLLPLLLPLGSVAVCASRTPAPCPVGAAAPTPVSMPAAVLSVTTAGPEGCIAAICSCWFLGPTDWNLTLLRAIFCLCLLLQQSLLLPVLLL